jgi:GxxExxY protein
MNTDKSMDIQPQKAETHVEFPEQIVTGKILECAFNVHNALGVGFLERVYSNALAIEMAAAGLICVQHAPLEVRYKSADVGDYVADMLVERPVLLELKACASLDPSHSAQIMNYLRASGIKVGLLLNFGRPRLEYRRFVY